MKKLDPVMTTSPASGGLDCLSPNHKDACGAIFDNSKRVVLIVRKDDLIQRDGVFELVTQPLRNRKLFRNAKFSKAIPFLSTPSSYSLGTGFFIRDNVVATAAHVFFPAHEDIKLADVRFIQGIRKDGDFNKILPEQIFRPDVEDLSKCPYRLSLSSEDWFLTKIKPDKHNTYPKGISTPEPTKVKRGCPVYIIGHGLGLSMKWNNNDSAKILINDINLPYFECNLPPFVSSSGAPVFHRETHDLIGMLVRGTFPFYEDGNTIHIRKNRSNFEGEECQRLAPMLEALNQI